jgi:hypothetical protein
MKDEIASEKTRMYCNGCKQETNHDLKAKHNYSWYDDEAFFGECCTYRFWICMGCERDVLQKSSNNSEMPDGEEEHSYFPKPSRFALPPKLYSKLKPKLAVIYKEAITCYNCEAMILCASGLRALLEGICQDKRIRGHNLKTKIDGLQPLLPNKNIVRSLHQFRFMGNEAAHELAAPKQAELALAIGIIEDLLNFFYELNHKASQLRDMRREEKRSVRRRNTSLLTVTTANRAE